MNAEGKLKNRSKSIERFPPASSPQLSKRLYANSFGNSSKPQIPDYKTDKKIMHNVISSGQIEHMESFVLQKPDNLVQLLPDINSMVENLVKNHPESFKDVWFHLKPILEENRSMLSGQYTSGRPEPPKPEPIRKTFVNKHGETMIDDFSYFTEKENPKVLDYLNKENGYARKALAHTNILQKVLFKEFINRVDENEESAKVTLADNYTYYTRREKGEEYNLHCRCDARGVEEVYLNENVLAKQFNLEYFKVGFLRHSGDYLAYGVDKMGNERYTVYFKNKNINETLPETIEAVSEHGLEFSIDGKYAFYLVLDEYERAWQLKRHELGTKTDNDTLLYEETDEMFFLTIKISCSGKYILVNSSAQITSETRYIPCAQPLDRPKLIFEKKSHVNYICEHLNDHFYVLTNENVKNNYLFRVPIPPRESEGPIDHASADTVVEHRDFVLIEDFLIRKNHIVVLERSNCMQNVRVIEIGEDSSIEAYHYISFSDLVYSVWLGTIADESHDLTKHSMFNSNILRYTYSTLVQPKQVIDYNMDTRAAVVVHEQSVQGYEGGYDPNRYVQRRLFTTGIDGTAIPISLVHRKDLLNMNDQPNPCLLYAYGAYGMCLNPIFNSNRLSLLDRGFIYAIAHVRGGADMGNAWYLEGKLEKKPNTFFDFISCSEFLIKEGYTSKDKLSIYGRSAGGLLIGAVVNARPDLFKAALTQVPFVDAINTMFDSTIPWTAFEYEEWGNPENIEIYEVMKQYCPYTNIRPQDYPNMLVVAGMNDPRVAYFEPAKFVAKLRMNKTDDNLLILRVENVGHGGSSGQYSNLEELAYEYAFLISTLNASYKPIDAHGDMLYAQIEKEEFEKEYLKKTEIPGSPRVFGVHLESVTRKKKKTAAERESSKLLQWISNLF